MRNARPRDARQLVVVDCVAVVRPQQIGIDVAQDVRRDRASLLGQPVRLELVVGEHHLRVEGRHDAVNRVLQQHDALALVRGPLEHVVQEQRLAQRRRHLRHEDRVSGVHEGLMCVREERVHRMAHLVGKREHGVERVVVVQQHVRMHAVHGR